MLPDRGAPLPPLPGCRFAATTEDDLAPLFAGAWPLAGARRSGCASSSTASTRSRPPTSCPPAALGLRLMLVHAFRELALRDPLLLRGGDRATWRSCCGRLAAGPARRADGAVPCRLRAGRGAAAEAGGGGGAPAAPGARLPGEIALADPLLPPELVPAGWPGEAARTLFVRLYLALTPASDAGVTARFVDREGPLRPDPERLARRLRALRAG